MQRLLESTAAKPVRIVLKHHITTCCGHILSLRETGIKDLNTRVSLFLPSPSLSLSPFSLHVESLSLSRSLVRNPIVDSLVALLRVRSCALGIIRIHELRERRGGRWWRSWRCQQQQQCQASWRRRRSPYFPRGCTDSGEGQVRAVAFFVRVERGSRRAGCVPLRPRSPAHGSHPRTLHPLSLAARTRTPRLLNQQKSRSTSRCRFVSFRAPDNTPAGTNTTQTGRRWPHGGGGSWRRWPAFEVGGCFQESGAVRTPQARDWQHHVRNRVSKSFKLRDAATNNNGSNPGTVWFLT